MFAVFLINTQNVINKSLNQIFDMVYNIIDKRQFLHVLPSVQLKTKDIDSKNLRNAYSWRLDLFNDFFRISSRRNDNYVGGDARVIKLIAQVLNISHVIPLAVAVNIKLITIALVFIVINFTITPENLVLADQFIDITLSILMLLFLQLYCCAHKSIVHI